MRHSLGLLSALLAVCFMLLLAGCHSAPRDYSDTTMGTEPVVEEGEAFEEHEIVTTQGGDDPTKPGTEWIPAKARAPITVEPAGELSFSPAGNPRWFLRASAMWWGYEQTLDNGFGLLAAIGHRLGDDGWFLEAEFAFPEAEVNIAGPGGETINETGRLNFFTLNVGKEFYLDDAKDWRLRGHVGMGAYDTGSFFWDDTGWAGTAGVVGQYRLYKDLWISAGASWYTMRADILDIRERSGDLQSQNTFWQNLVIDLGLQIDF